MHDRIFLLFNRFVLDCAIVMGTKIILFGGTFDPIHLGHTKVIKHFAEHIGADKTVFIPAKCSPHKSQLPLASDADRIKMISLAIEGENGFEVSDCELKGDLTGYTLDTVKYFRKFYGKHAQLYWPVGADAIKDLGKWHGIEELIDECELSVMYRAGFEKPCFCKYKAVLGPEQITKLRENVISTPLINISSTQIRQNIFRGFGVDDMVAPEVLDHIKRNHLYSS